MSGYVCRAMYCGGGSRSDYRTVDVLPAAPQRQWWDHHRAGVVGICISSFFLFLPRYWQTSTAGNSAYPYPSLRSLAYTLYYSLKAVSGGQEIDVLETIEPGSLSPLFQLVYFVLNYGYFLAAPLLTSGLILSMIGDLADQFRCRIGRGRKYYVFSELNGNTMNLAEKIRAKQPKGMLVFCGTKNADKDLLSRAKTMGAAVLYAPCVGAKLSSGWKSLQFYLLSADEDVNLRCAEDLIRKYKNKSNRPLVINAFAESGTGIQMVESMDKENIGVRFIDGTALLCSELLLRHPLNRLPADRKTISLVIIGCDKLGMRMLKTAAWCGQAEGLALKLRVYDRNAETLKKRLQAQCPELMDHCDLDFVTVDARTAELETAVIDPGKGSPEATCIVMAMGDDELNIAVAERMFRLFRHHNRYGWNPLILARIRNANKSEVYKEQENPYLKARNISPFGGVEEVFADSTLFHSYLENLSFAVELCYCGLLPEKDPATMTVRELREYWRSDAVRVARSQFLQSEYNRRSSMAAALHIPVKLRSVGLMPEEETIPSPETACRFCNALKQDPGLLEKLARNEHARWNQFMRSEGYVRADWEDLQCFYPALEKKNNQDALGKRHLCLVDWEQLGEVNRQYLTLEPPVRKDFKKSDYEIVRRIPDIILLAKRMEETEPEDLL